MWYATCPFSEKKMNFNLLRGGGGGLPPGSRVCGQNICYHFCCIRDSLLFDMQHDHVLKKVNFDLLREESAGKIFATMLLHLWFFLIWYAHMTMFWKRVLTFWPHPQGLGGGLCSQNICYQVSAFVIPFNYVCKMTMFWISWILTCWPQPLSPLRGSATGFQSKITLGVGGGGGLGGVCKQNICYATICDSL